MVWQEWRKFEGRKPTLRDDNYTPSPQGEVVLWRATMALLFGPQWEDRLKEERRRKAGSIKPFVAQIGTPVSSSRPRSPETPKVAIRRVLILSENVIGLPLML